MTSESTQGGRLTLVRVNLPDGGVDVRYGSTVLAGEEFSALERTLSPAERERAGRFHFARDRERFVVARGLLRRILAGYLDIAAGEVEFRYGTAGKPELDVANPDGAVRFNLSHSGDWALVAVAHGRQIGVDVEMVRDGEALEDVATRFFHPREVASLAALTAAGRRLTFYRYWTRKEAYLKARGDGLSSGLAALDTSGLCGTPGRAVRFADPLSADRFWWMFDLDLAHGYRAAVVVEAGERAACSPPGT